MSKLEAADFLGMLLMSFVSVQEPLGKHQADKEPSHSIGVDVAGIRSVDDADEQECRRYPSDCRAGAEPVPDAANRLPKSAPKEHEDKNCRRNTHLAGDSQENVVWPFVQSWIRRGIAEST